MNQNKADDGTRSYRIGIHFIRDHRISNYDMVSITSSQKVSSEMFAFILTIVGLYSDESSGSMPAVKSMSSTIRLLASRAVRAVR